MEKNIKRFKLPFFLVCVVMFLFMGCSRISVSNEPVLNEKQQKVVDTICEKKDVWNVGFEDGSEYLLIVGWVFSIGDHGSVKTYGGKTRTYAVAGSEIERVETDSNMVLYSRGISVDLSQASDETIREYVENAYLNYLHQKK